MHKHQHPSLTRSLLTFALVGPAVAGLVVFVVILVAIVLPDFLSNPSNTFGRNRLAEFGGTLALVVLFSFPVGLLPALASGFAHHLLREKIFANRLRSTLLVCLVGMVVMEIQLSLFLGAESLLLLPVAGISAALASLYASRPKRHSAASQETPPN